MKNNIILILFIVLGYNLYAQNDNVTIIYTGNREVEKAYRLTDQPRIIDTVLSLPPTNYPLLSLHYTAPIQLDTIKLIELLNSEFKNSLAFRALVDGFVSIKFELKKS